MLQFSISSAILKVALTLNIYFTLKKACLPVQLNGIMNKLKIMPVSKANACRV